jgi:hypothetical protein
LGSVSIASAGTVTTKGDTNISIGGFIAEYMGFVNNQSDLFATTASNPGMYNSSGTHEAQTNFSSTANVTRLVLNLDNKAEGITGQLSGDFRGSTNSGDDGFRLRQAWFMKLFCQEGCNYTPWLLVGQTNTLNSTDSYSLLNLPIGGVAGSAAANPTWVPQVAFGVKFDLGNIKLNPEIAVMDLQKLANNYDGYNPDNPYYGVASTRTNMPGFGVKVPIEFNTGLGAPASFYADAQMQTIKINHYDKNGILSTNNSKTSWMVGGGLSLPIYFVTLKGDVAYSKGFTNMNYIYGDTNGMFPETPPSYWVDNTGTLQQTHATQWDVEAQVDFSKFAQVPLTLSGGYSQVVFSNLPFQDNQTWNYFNSNAPVRKASTMFANVAYNLTKSTTLGVEYDRNKTYYTVNPNDSFNSNAVYLVGMYNF